MQPPTQRDRLGVIHQFLRRHFFSTYRNGVATRETFTVACKNLNQVLDQIGNPQYAGCIVYLARQYVNVFIRDFRVSLSQMPPSQAALVDTYEGVVPQLQAYIRANSAPVLSCIG
jgi:hypothetical protein